MHPLGTFGGAGAQADGSGRWDRWDGECVEETLCFIQKLCIVFSSRGWQVSAIKSQIIIISISAGHTESPAAL